ncbi:TolC family protein [bacterium]|nr:TolC family protein [bacterium]
MKRVLGLIGTLLTALCLTAPLMAETLSVEQCVSISLQNNPQLAQSRFSKDMAGRDVIDAMANFLPSARFSMGYNHTVNGPRNAVWFDPTTGLAKPTQIAEEMSWSSSAGLSASQSLFSGGYNYFNLKNSLAMKRSAEFQLEDTRQQVIYMVKERYYNLLKAQKLLDVSQEALKSSEESFKLADAKYQVGTAPKSEMLQFKVELENAKLAMIEAQHNLSIARTLLNQVLGIDMDEDIQVVDDWEMPELDVELDQALRLCEENHPQLLKSVADVDGAKTYIGMAASSFLPYVTANYYYGWSHQDFGEIKHARDRNYNWSLGVTLSFPLFQGFTRISSMSRAMLNHKMNKEILNYTERQLDLELKQAYFSLQQAKKKITVTEDAEEAADETLRLNKEKYNLGAGTMLDLINAQSSYTLAKSNRIQALYDYKFAVARLKRAMGRLTE